MFIKFWQTKHNFLLRTQTLPLRILKTTLVVTAASPFSTPRLIGLLCILFQERDFDKHVAYCRDEPQAQEFLQDTSEARDFYEVSLGWFGHSLRVCVTLSSPGPCVSESGTLANLSGGITPLQSQHVLKGKPVLKAPPPSPSLFDGSDKRPGKQQGSC